MNTKQGTPATVANTATVTPAECANCDGLGYTSDLLGGCGDPECCGGPVKVKCYACVNDWEG